ncbi:hypothetical protein QHH11_29205, partial [Aphanizomenon sp. PH219]|nr:hypothetical protein [Aphanizomenon sp. PH219]
NTIKPNCVKKRKIAQTLFTLALLSNWTKIFTVIAREGKQSQPWRLLHFTSFPMANATQR